jgi:PBP1b-binding outer membrane lipoprotein LpoB
MSRIFTIALFATLALGACSKKAKYIDPDAESKVEGTGIESRDIRAIVGEMTDELLASNSIKNFQGLPRVAVLPVENRTRFLIDQDIFTTLITDQVIQGASGKLAVVNRDLLDQIVKEREMKRSGQVDSTMEFKALAGVEFFLEGELRGLAASTNKNQSDYIVVRFQLTDTESGIISWSNSYEMKKEGSWGVMYQ